MYLRTLQALQNLQKAPVEQVSTCHVGIHADTSPEETQPLAPPIGFVPPIASAPPVSQEDHESSSKESLETDRDLADQASSPRDSPAHDS